MRCNGTRLGKSSVASSTSGQMVFPHFSHGDLTINLFYFRCDDVLVESVDFAPRRASVMGLGEFFCSTGILSP